MSISTKTGDDGSTSLLFNKRVSKTHPRVVCYGSVDELASSLGVCRAHCMDVNAKTQLLEIQIELVHFSLIEKNEKKIQFKGWTQAGETIADAFFDQARTTCRRAERGTIALKESGTSVRSELIIYLNRLADLLWLWGIEHAQLAKK